MKRITKDQLDKALKQLLDCGKVVVGEILVNDGENTVSYTALSACPPEHREGYRRALETVREVSIRDVVYDPVLIAREHAKSIATLE